MAQQVKKNTTTKNVSENIEKENIKVVEEKSSDKDSIIEQLKKDNDSKDQKIEELSKGFSELQEKLNLLLSGGMLGQGTKEPSSEDILVGFRGIYVGVLSNSDGSIQYKFEANDEKVIDSEDLKILFRESKGTNNRKLFEDDIFYFVDEENYAKFKIKKRVDLSRENIIRILTMKNSNEAIGELSKLTNDKLDFNILHTFQYQVARLIIDGSPELNNWNWQNREDMERYIGQKFNDLLASLGAVELLGRKKFKN
jgi:hypothetical protein